MRITPAPGPLRRLTSRMPHPRGFIETALEFPAPGGDMMLTGSFGLVEGLRLQGRL